MGIVEQTILAFTLCLDSVVIMASIAMSHGEMKWFSRHLAFSVLSLSIIQTLLAYLGIIIGEKILPLIQNWDHWIIFILFTYFAWKQWTWKPENNQKKKGIGYIAIIILGFLSGIDAFIASLSLGHHLYSEILYLVSVLIFTAFFTITGPKMLIECGPAKWKKGNQIAAVLIFLLGTKILIEHLFFK